MIPEIEFEQSSLRAAITLLQQAAAKADPKKRNLPIAFGFTPEQEQALKSKPITCHARNISALDALQLFTELAKVNYGVRKDVVAVMPLDAPEGELFTRKYTVSPVVFEKIFAIASGLAAGSERPSESLKKMFIDLGFSWPAGPSIAWQANIGKLVVCNTQENLDLLGKRFEELGGVTHQVRVDVQFVAFDSCCDKSR